MSNMNGQTISDVLQQNNDTSYQAELKHTLERAFQIEAWEKLALARLHEANIKLSEHQFTHHQTHLSLIQSLNDNESLRLQLQSIIQARDSDIFWRLANPFRKVIATFPRSMILYSRKILKLLYWAASPWKMKSRLQYIKNRNAALIQTIDPFTQKTTNMLNSVQTPNTNDIVLNASARDLYTQILKSMTESKQL
jgi:hypothetical protein